MIISVFNLILLIYCSSPPLSHIAWINMEKEKRISITHVCNCKRVYLINKYRYTYTDERLQVATRKGRKDTRFIAWPTTKCRSIVSNQMAPLGIMELYADHVCEICWIDGETKIMNIYPSEFIYFEHCDCTALI